MALICTGSATQSFVRSLVVSAAERNQAQRQPPSKTPADTTHSGIATHRKSGVAVGSIAVLAPSRSGFIRSGGPDHLAGFQTSENGLSSPTPICVYVSPSTLILNLNVFLMWSAVLSFAYSMVSV